MHTYIHVHVQYLKHVVCAYGDMQSWTCVLYGSLQQWTMDLWDVLGSTDQYKLRINGNDEDYLYWNTGDNTFIMSSSHSSLFRFSDVPAWVSRYTLQHQCMQCTLFAPTPMYLCAYIHTTPVHAAYTVCTYSNVPVCIQYT